MDYREFAEYLANKDGMGCNDYEYAEFFVMLDKLIRLGKPASRITTEDMLTFDVDEFCKWLATDLRDIIFSPFLCDGAWWKDSDDFETASEAAFEKAPALW